MQLVERHIIHSTDPHWQQIDAAAFRGKNVYNAALYRVRQHYFETGQYLNYNAVEKHFKKGDLLEDQRLPLAVVQQVLIKVDGDLRSFFAGLKAYQKAPTKFTGRPKLPKYKDKTKGRSVLVYTINAISKKSLKSGVIKLTGLNLTIPTKVPPNQFNQVRIVPKSNHAIIEVIYTVEDQLLEGLNQAHVLGIDMGVDNIATLTSNQPGFIPLLINGRVIKSINQRYNKRVAQLQSQLGDNRHTSKQINQLTFKRNQQIQHHLHCISRKIIDLMQLCGMGTLVIGKNDGWKQEVDIGRKNNQNFVQIPHARLIEMLIYKAQLVGIVVIVTEESYTSKCSFLDQEPLQKHDGYMGKRVRRSEFVSGSGQRIHADVNGSYNIIRKVIPNAFDASGIAAAAVMPLRANTLV